jgi:hypothetical protein
MDDTNKTNEVPNNERELQAKVQTKTEDAFFEEAEKVVNRLLKQYDTLLEVSKKYHAEDKDINYMFNAIKKHHDLTKKAFKDSDKDNGFTFKK